MEKVSRVAAGAYIGGVWEGMVESKWNRNSRSSNLIGSCLYRWSYKQKGVMFTSIPSTSSLDQHQRNTTNTSSILDHKKLKTVPNLVLLHKQPNNFAHISSSTFTLGAFWTEHHVVNLTRVIHHPVFSREWLCSPLGTIATILRTPVSLFLNCMSTVVVAQPVSPSTTGFFVTRGEATDEEHGVRVLVATNLTQDIVGSIRLA